MIQHPRQQRDRADQRDRVAGFVARAKKQKHIEITAGGRAGSGGGFLSSALRLSGRGLTAPAASARIT